MIFRQGHLYKRAPAGQPQLWAAQTWPQFSLDFPAVFPEIRLSSGLRQIMFGFTAFSNLAVAGGLKVSDPLAFPVPGGGYVNAASELRAVYSSFHLSGSDVYLAKVTPPNQAISQIGVGTGIGKASRTGGIMLLSQDLSEIRYVSGCSF